MPKLKKYMETSIRINFIGAVIFVVAFSVVIGFASLASADEDGYWNMNDINNYQLEGTNNGYGILYPQEIITSTPPEIFTSSFPEQTATVVTPPEITTEIFQAPEQTATVTTPPEITTEVISSPTDYTTYTNYYNPVSDYYPGFRGGFAPSFGLGFGISPSFASPAFFSSPAIIQPAFVSSAPSVSSASASATAVANVTNINTVSAPPQYQAQYIAPTYVTPTYYTPPQYPAQYIPPPPPPPPALYVALTQIPYTGIDGSVAYWLTLIGLAGAAAYFVVSYLPHLVGAKAGGFAGLALAGGLIRRKQVQSVTPVFETRSVAKTFAAEKHSGTTDKMVTEDTKDGPRIVINRD